MTKGKNITAIDSVKPKPASRFRGAGFLLVLIYTILLPVYALEQSDANDIPHVGQSARDNFANYIYSGNNKAFAIAPGGAWAWSNGLATEEQATAQAIRDCEANSKQRCLVYAVNDEIVFDERLWYSMLRPYSNATTAKEASTGTKRGMRFPDIKFRDAKRRKRNISSYRGKVAIVHFWGSWCPPCMRELPGLRKFYRGMGKRLKGKAELILLQVREPFSDSRRWLKQNQLTGLPLYDSGMKSEDDTDFQLAGGGLLPDRDIAMFFPTTYILDKNGIVLLARYGPIHDWSEYHGFIKDAAR